MLASKMFSLFSVATFDEVFCVCFASNFFRVIFPASLTNQNDFAVEHNITAEQLASQIVQQWVKTLPSNIKNVYQKTD